MATDHATSCGVVWRIRIAARYGTRDDPARWSRHRDGGSIRWFSPTACAIMFIGLALKPHGCSPMSMPAMVFREALVAIEEKDVSLSGQICVATDTSNPDQHFAGQKIESKWPR